MSDYTSNTGASSGTTDHINHITSDVSECKYHAHQDVCEASMINVAPCASNCATDRDTSCLTFEKQN